MPDLSHYVSTLQRAYESAVINGTPVAIPVDVAARILRRLNRKASEAAARRVARRLAKQQTPPPSALSHDAQAQTDSAPPQPN